VGGYGDGLVPEFSWAFISSASYYYVLPFLSIFLVVLGGQAIGMRSMCIYELGTDYVKYAKLLGIQESKILLYMFRNAMLPQLTGLALALGAMVGGALVTEIIFSYPGLGMTVLTAIQTSDYTVITGATLLVTVTVLLANFGVDVLIGFLDPRVRAAQLGGK
jgi:peptide/nickel transport system permease protein